MRKEIWKNLANIVEYGEYYEVSNFGNVRRIGKTNLRKLLEWSERSENMQHAKESVNMVGTVKKGERQGEKNASVKLTESIIYKIVDDWNTEKYTYISLAKKTQHVQRSNWCID